MNELASGAGSTFEGAERIQGLTWDMTSQMRRGFTTDEFWSEFFEYIEQCRQEEVAGPGDYFFGSAERDG